MADPIREALERLLAVIKPKYTDPDEIVAVVRAMAAARAALAAEPPAPAEPDTDAVLALAAIIRQVDGSHSLGAAVLAEAILSHPKVASVFQPPAPAPADHVPDAGNMVAADEEREELAQWLERIGDDYDDLYRSPSALIRPKLARAAALLRQLPPEGLLAVEYVHIDSGARIISEPNEGCSVGHWAVLNSRHVNPCTEFRTVANAAAALKQEVGDE